MSFEYKVVPAPTRGRKAKGAKTAADRFARALEAVINDLAADGWDYIRTDTLPAEERQGLTGRTTVYQNMLVFRREIDAPGAAEPVPEETKAIAPPVTTPAPSRSAEPAAADPKPATYDTKAGKLHSRIADEIAKARAPKLPSAGAAQEVPEKRFSFPGNGKRDVAAE